ncbi:MAG TPA: alpha/beta hydrolase [Acidimicrobiales bacterium]|nr:alpha/beta hydrolase [Acidimicrobiales bacterium]
MTADRIHIPSADGLVFDALVDGPVDGEVVLLLHGFPQSAAIWLPQIDALAAAGYRAVAFDQRGYSPGARPDAVEEYRIGHLVADALEVGGARPFHVVGHDWGAVVGWHLAAKHPERIRTLAALSVPHPLAFATALVSPTSDQRAQSSYIAFFRQTDVAEEVLLAGGLAAALRATAYPGDVDERVRAMSEPGALTAALNWYRALDLDLLRGVGSVVVPTLYVWSTGDLALAREGAEATARHVAGPYRFEVLTGVSHWIPEEVPDTLTGLLLEHLSRA